MKCLYYLSPTLDTARVVSDDLHAIGIDDWYIHVVSKNEAGLKREKIHSSNNIETSDAFAGAFTGAIIGFIVGALAMMVLRVAVDTSAFIYAAVLIGPTLFGAWEGGLLRAKYENRKLAPFHDELEAGKYLFLIYTPKGKGESVKAMMRDRHPETEHAAEDEHFMDPLGSLKRI